MLVEEEWAPYYDFVSCRGHLLVGRCIMIYIFVGCPIGHPATNHLKKGTGGINKFSCMIKIKSILYLLQVQTISKIV